MRTWQHGNTWRIDRDNGQPLFCFWKTWRLGFNLEFPSEWHEWRLGRLTLSPIFGNFVFYFPWYKVYEDHGQCSGPQFGIEIFHMDSPGLQLWIHYGNNTGRCGESKLKIIVGPWDWGTAIRFDKAPVEGVYDYTYTLKSGEVQKRKVTLAIHEREWTRWWLPSHLISRGINVEFNEEIGEGCGSWKGGTVGCGWDLLDGEDPVECLRRMESRRLLL